MYYSYIPKYDELDYLYNKYLKNNSNIRLNFFFDVKNGIYNYETLNDSNQLEHAVELISALINIIPYIKNRFKSQYNIDTKKMRFFYFCETGKSSYHRAIDISYKSNRQLNDYLMRDDSNELFSKIVFFVIQTLNDLINLIPNAYFYLGEFREFDYIPYVIHKQYFNNDDVSIIFSSDKDMFQINSYLNNIEQLEKIKFKKKVEWHPGRLFINRDNYIQRFTYQKLGKMTLTDEHIHFLHNHFSFVRAVIGDSGDGVQGLKGIGLSTLLKIYKPINNILLSRDEYNNNIKHLNFSKFDFKRDNVIFDLTKINDIENDIKKSSRLKKIIQPESIERLSKNLALMDYDIMMHRRKQKDYDIINSIYTNNNKFKNNQEVIDFINNTGLWKICPQFPITIIIE